MSWQSRTNALALLVAWACLSQRHPVRAQGQAGQADAGLDEARPEASYTIELPECVKETPMPWRASLPLRFPPQAKKAPDGEGKVEGEQQPSKKTIPNIVHFVFGYKEDAMFDFVNFASIASVLAVMRPEAVMVHCFRTPTGFLWDLIEPHVQLVRARQVKGIWGREILHYAHKADIVRLETLLTYGGIYMDADVIALRPFDELLSSATADVILGQAGEQEPVRFGNGVILAAPEAEFLLKWYNAYKTFDHNHWNYHSAEVPVALAREDPKLIDQRSHKAFHWPFWDDTGIKLMLDSYEYDYKENYAVHLWASTMPNSQYRGFSMPWCFECHSTLVSMLRAYVPDPLFTVVIPCLDQAAYIKEAMRSIVEQTFPSWEMIVVDDASKDNCGKAAESFAKKLGFYNKGRFKLITNAKSEGGSEARNIGIRQARGLWICSLDAEDKVQEDYFRKAAEVISLEPDLQLLSSNEQLFGNSTDIRQAPEFHTTLLTKGRVLPAASLYLRSTWETTAGYSRALPWGFADYDFFLSLSAIGVKYRKLDGELVYYRYNPTRPRDQPIFVDATEGMVRSRHPEIYHAAMLLAEHKRVMNMTPETRARLQEAMKRGDASDMDTAWRKFWLALSDVGNKNHAEAVKKLSGILDMEPLRWQARWYYAQSLCKSQGPTAQSAQIIEELDAKHPDLHITMEFLHLRRNCQFNLR